MTDVRRERIPLLWSTLGDTALAKGFCSNMGNTKYSVCLQKNEGTYSAKRSEKLAGDEPEKKM